MQLQQQAHNLSVCVRLCTPPRCAIANKEVHDVSFCANFYKQLMCTLFWMVTLRSATGATACCLLDWAPRPRPLPPPVGLPALVPPGFLPVLRNGILMVTPTSAGVPEDQDLPKQGSLCLVWYQSADSTCAPCDHGRGGIQGICGCLCQPLLYGWAHVQNSALCHCSAADCEVLGTSRQQPAMVTFQEARRTGAFFRAWTLTPRPPPTPPPRPPRFLAAAFFTAPPAAGLLTAALAGGLSFAPLRRRAAGFPAEALPLADLHRQRRLCPLQIVSALLLL